MGEKGERESKTQFQQDQQTGIKCHISRGTLYRVGNCDWGVTNVIENFVFVDRTF